MTENGVKCPIRPQKSIKEEADKRYSKRKRRERKKKVR